jgi:predicted  nucleic acid-binding Zn-ribbon protein
MSVQGYDELVFLNRKIDELIKSYKTLKEQNSDLKARAEALERELEEREATLKELEKRYDRIKLTGALIGDGGNATEAKRKINDLVREIDKCIALLDR